MVSDVAEHRWDREFGLEVELVFEEQATFLVGDHCDMVKCLLHGGLLASRRLEV